MRLGERGLCQALAQALGRWAHETAVTRHADRQRQGTLGAHGFRPLDGAGDRRAMTGDDDLPRRVEVDGLDHFALGGGGAHRLHGGVLEPEHRGHPALAGRHRIAHELAAYADEIDRILEAEGSRRDQGREFAEAMARDPIRRRPARRAPGAPGRHPGDQHQRLRDLGERELLGGPLLRERPQVEVENAGGGVEGLAYHGVRLGQRGHHPDRLGPLPRKHERSRHQPLRGWWIKVGEYTACRRTLPQPAGSCPVDRQRLV